MTIPLRPSAPLALVLLLTAACSGAPQDSSERTSESESDLASHGFSAAPPLPNTPWSWNGWSYAGTIDYLGGSGTLAWPLQAQVATHVLLEAPIACAPRVTYAQSVLFPSHARFPMLFEGQRYSGTVVQAEYDVGHGTSPAVIDQLILSIVGRPGAACPIRVYAFDGSEP